MASADPGESADRALADTFDAVLAAELPAAAVPALRDRLLAIVRSAFADADQRRSAQVDRLLATASRVSESLELETVLAAIVEDARVLIGAHSGDMLLWDRERGMLRVVAVSGHPVEMVGYEVAFGDGMSTQAILARRVVQTDDYASYEHRAPGLDGYTFGAVICAPLIFRGDAIGALNLHRPRGDRHFGAEDGELLTAFAGHAAIAIDHARRYENEVRLGRTLADTNRELSRSLAVQQRLAEQVLLDGGPPGIAAALAEHLGRRVVIQDHIRRVIAGAAPDGSEDWRALLDRVPDGERGRSGRRPLAAEPFAVAVRVGREVVGHLLLSADEELGPIDRALVDVAVTGVALEFAKLRAALEAEERLRGEATTELLAGTFRDEVTVAARAARLGHDLGAPHDILVFDVAGATDDAAASHDRERMLLALLREQVTARAPRSLAVSHGGSFVALVAQPQRRERDARQLAEELRVGLESVAGAGTVTVAVGSVCGRPADYAPAFQACRQQLDVMLKLGRGGAVIGPDVLGPYGLLLEAVARPELEAFARSALEPLIEHDRTHRAELLKTLRTYLDEDRVQRRAAAQLFVHVNTIVYRIDRIERLLGRSLSDPSAVFDLTLALRIADVLDAT